MTLRQSLCALIFVHLFSSGLVEAAVPESSQGGTSPQIDSDSDFNQIFLDLKAASKPRIFRKDNSESSSAGKQPRITAEQGLHRIKKPSLSEFGVF
jgi:hypothetical protein